MTASSPAASTIPPSPCSGGWDSNSERCSRTTCRTRSAITTACSSCSTRTGTSRGPCVLVLRVNREKESDVPSIVLKTEVPGPKSRAMLARRAASVPTGLSKATDIVVERAEGALVHDVDGNTFIDFVGGIGALAVGHCPPNVIEAMHAEAQQLVHMCSLVGTYESYVRVCELLNEVTPGAFAKKTLLANSGAEAVENAVKAARAYTKRPAV